MLRPRAVMTPGGVVMRFQAVRDFTILARE